MRKTGHYWVKDSKTKEWFIAYYVDLGWLKEWRVPGMMMGFDDCDFDEIDENPIIRGGTK